MDKGKFYSGLAIMVGLIVLGAMMPLAVKQFRSFDRTVNVKGLCEREVKADKAIWPIVYKVMSNDIQEVNESIARNNSLIVDFLKKGGLDASEITVSVPKISDKYATEYGSNDRAYRYIATNVITVCTEDVDAVLELRARQSELIRNGIIIEVESWENPLEFRFEGLNSLKPEMVEEATKNARATAKKFAEDSDCDLGDVRSAQQGQFSIEDRDANTPYIKRIRVVNTMEYALE